MGKETALGRTGFELLERLQLPGCPACALVGSSVTRYLERISYDMVNDLSVRDELRKAIGYCAAHGREWLRLQNTLGTAIIYFDVLTNVRRAIDACISQGSEQQDEGGGVGLFGRLQGLLSRSGAAAGPALADALEPSLPCPACRVAAELEDDVVGSFATGLSSARFMAAYREHQAGLCLPHLREVLRRLGDPALVTSVARVQEAKLARSCAEMAEVMRKNDYRFVHEEKGAEFAAPERAVEQAGGRLPTQLNRPKGVKRDA